MKNQNRAGNGDSKNRAVKQGEKPLFKPARDVLIEHVLAYSPHSKLDGSPESRASLAGVVSNAAEQGPQREAFLEALVKAAMFTLPSSASERVRVLRAMQNIIKRKHPFWTRVEGLLAEAECAEGLGTDPLFDAAFKEMTVLETAVSRAQGLLYLLGDMAGDLSASMCMDAPINKAQNSALAYLAEDVAGLLRKNVDSAWKAVLALRPDADKAATAS